jgi:Pyridoxamine 5'-phosphate oxidase
MDPVAEPLELPAGYGKAATTLAWADVRARLEAATQYWVATTRADGRPHAVPVDGLWLDDVWYWGGSPRTVHVRTARANPAVAMHLPDPTQAVVVEGTAGEATPAPALDERLIQASRAKYGYAPPTGTYRGALALRPRLVLAWTAFPNDATRFRFPPEG